MYSWLVTVLLLARAAISSGGQGACSGERVGWGREGGVYQLAVPVSPHRCTSAHHKLHMYTT